MGALEEFKRLLEVTEHLMGPDGCPWDREQTLNSMRGSLLEEAYEVLEAIEENDDRHLSEELGDLLYNVIFFCQLGEKEKRFSLTDSIKQITDKLIHRHPHVFGDKKLVNSDEIIDQWEKIKKESRESLMDGIPKAMPALARASKMASKLKRARFEEAKTAATFDSEKELGDLLWEIVKSAKEKKIDPEEALRKTLFEKERIFREWEKQKGF